MALIVGGTTVTGTQVLDATKLSGNLPALNGSSLTNLPASSSIPAVSLNAVGSFAMISTNQSRSAGGTLNLLGAMKWSSAEGGSGGGNSGMSGTWRIHGYTNPGGSYHASVWQRIS